jgi:hypothetical protein
MVKLENCETSMNKTGIMKHQTYSGKEWVAPDYENDRMYWK